METKDTQKLPELLQKPNFLGKLTSLFIDRYRLTYLVILIITVMGVSSFLLLPRESLPDIVFPAAIVTTPFIGASPEDVESLVTDPIEQKLSELSDLDSITSNSLLGLSQVTVTFKSGTDVSLKEMLIQNKVDELTLPDGVEKSSVNVFSTSEIPLMNLTLIGKYDKYTLTRIAEDMKDAISKVDGVGNVKISGGLSREFHVRVDLLKLMTYKLSLSSLQSAISSANINVPIGDKDLNGQYYNLRIQEKMTSVEELENLLIPISGGGYVYLRDVAVIEDTYEKINETTRMYVPGVTAGNEALASVYLTVEREGGSNVISASQGVKKLIADNKGILYPTDVTPYISNDQAVSVREDLTDVTNNALSGLIVVVVVLFLFIGLSESLIVAAIIPLSLLCSFVAMDAVGMSLNSLSLLGLIVSLGLLVDNAIVVMQNIDRFHTQGLNRTESARIGTNQISIAILSSTLTTLAAFFPLVLLPDTLGDFVRPIPLTIIFALTASLVISLIITPVLCARHLPEKKSPLLAKYRHLTRPGAIIAIIGLCFYAFMPQSGALVLPISAALLFGLAMWVRQYPMNGKGFETSTLADRYVGFLGYVLEKRKRMFMVILAGFLALVLSLGMIPLGLLKIEFFPVDDPSSLTIQLEAPPSTTLSDTSGLTAGVEALLIKYPEIKSFNTRIGGSNPNVSDIQVELTDKFSRKRTGFEILEALRLDVQNIPGAVIRVNTESNRGPSGSGKPLVIELKGQDIDLLYSTSRDFSKILAQDTQVVSPELNIGEGAPQVILDIHRNKLIEAGLNPSQAALEIRGYISGIKAATFTINQDDVAVLLQLPEKNLTTLKDLNKIYLTSTAGQKFPLSSFVTLKEVSGLSKIVRKDSERVITISADITPGANLNEVLNRFNGRLDPKTVPEGISYKFGGDRQSQTDSFINLGRSMILAALLVFLILAVQFNSISQPFIILMTIPMAIVGVMGGLVVTGNAFGFYAFMGLVALVGIAVNNAILLIDYVNYLRSVGFTITDALVRSGRTRLIPVFATTITTIGGILPLALKNTYYAQLCFSIIFGLMVATVLTLLFIPVLYALFESRRLRKIPSGVIATPALSKGE